MLLIEIFLISFPTADDSNSKPSDTKQSDSKPSENKPAQTPVIIVVY